MFHKFKSAVSSAVALARGDMGDGDIRRPTPPKEEKFSYSRPQFLQLTEEEVQGSRDFGIRPILIPRDVTQLPWRAGYSEALNGGKSDYNEDQSVAVNLRIKPRWQTENIEGSWRHGPLNSQVPLTVIPPDTQVHSVQATYYAIFDGHAGYGAAVNAANLLHKHVQEKLESCLEIILQKTNLPTLPNEEYSDPIEQISCDQLVIGALEEAFADMDDQLEREMVRYFIPGGCTALVALLFNGKLFVANAGDCRAVLCKGTEVRAMSRDFTAETEKQRVNYLGYTNPELLHDEFSYMEFPRRLNRCDIGNRVLCRQPGNEGWSMKTATEDDLKFPLVIGTGKRARLMGTIGVTRGLGDHNLFVMDSNIRIKPFLSCHPEVQVLDLTADKLTEDDVLIMGSDGLWDTISNEQVAGIVRQTLKQTNKLEDNRYTIAAQELVLEARGVFTGKGWRKKHSDGAEAASFDDITAFVIPLKPYCDFWKQNLVVEESQS